MTGAERESVLGDLAEEYAERCAESGRVAAQGWYWLQAIGFMRPAVIRAMRSGAGAGSRTGVGESVGAGWRVRRGAGGAGTMETMLQDIRFGVRSIVRSPGFAVIAVATLALGIGANALVFAVVDGIVLNPFPFPEPQRLVGVGTQFPRLGEDVRFIEHMSPAEYVDIREGSSTLEHVVAWDMGNRQVTFGDVTENLFSGFWYGDAFPTLGVTPAMGRGFDADEIRRGDRVAILSHRVWQQRFGADPSLVGGTVLMNSDPYTVVGIMPPGVLVFGMDLWLPMPGDPGAFPRGRRQFQILARLAEGATLESANTELSTIARRIEQEYGASFEEYTGWRLVVSTWTDINVQQLKPAAILLMSAVGFVLLLVCANVASLLLARASGRWREMAVRTALGAGRTRLLRQLLTESVVLGIAGGVVGVLLGWIGVRAVSQALTVLPLPVPTDLSVTGRVLAYTALAAILAAILFGLAPALYASRLQPQRTLQSEGQSVLGSRTRQRLQRLMVGVEVALAVLLVSGSALFVHSYLRLQRVDPGFRTESLLTMRMTLARERYTPDQVEPFFIRVRDEVGAIPGVVSVATASQFPPRAFLRNPFQIEGAAAAGAAALPTAYTTIASPGYFETMGLTRLEGRGFSEQDRTGSPFVVVANEAAARRFFPDGALGGRIRTSDDSPWLEIVGVVASAHNDGLDAEPAPELFVSSLQASGWFNQLFLIVRTEAAPRTVLPAIRTAITAIDPEQPIYAIQTIDEAFATLQAPRRVSTTMLTLFGLFALVLAAVGVYGVVAYAASQRTREIGVRMALGAERSQVHGLVIRQGLVPVAIGALVGLAGAIAAGRFISSLLYEVRGSDPLSLAAALTVMGLIAWSAAWFPARRASRLDPVRALRTE
ncbi:MAG: ABC transporter permease [Gemmatimonadetes bacterium]|nr:ABC transporter permease [Gemmatimonadota bacterium]